MRLLSLLVLAPLALSAQQGAAPASGQPQSRIARIVVSPVQKVVVAGDSVRFRAEARDANNNVIPNVTFRWTRSGMARFEGQMREDGTLVSGSTGTLPITVVGIIPGEAPKVEQFDVRMVPGPAARIAISPTPSRLVPGQRIRLGAEVLSAKNDRRDDKVMWRSSAPAIARVNEVGVVTAVAAGRATITASVGAVQQAMAVQVLPSAVASLTVTPEASDARTGDVIRFRAVAKDAAGKPIDGITPVWSFNPGQGMIDPDGAFVGYEAGAYTVTASLGNRAAEAVVTLAPRDVRRPLTRRSPPAAHALHHRGGLAAPQRQGRVPRLGRRRRRAGPSTSPTRRSRSSTDSIVANTRRVNDVMTTPDGKFLVFTREGASDRKNGSSSHARGPAASQGDLGVHRRRHGRRALGVHLQGAKYGSTSTSRTTAPARCTCSTSTTRRKPRRWRSGRPTAPRRPAARCTTSTCRTACSTAPGGTTGWSSSTSATGSAAARRRSR
jgi:hypothetical protein